MRAMETSTPPEGSLLERLGRDGNSLVLVAFALALLVFVLYLPALRNGFVNYDDPDYLTHNARVLQGLSWENVKWAFGTDNPAANWHPLTWLSCLLYTSPSPRD